MVTMWELKTEVGTQFLVYDLERLRKAVGAKKLTVYGEPMAMGSGWDSNR